MTRSSVRVRVLGPLTATLVVLLAVFSYAIGRVDRDATSKALESSVRATRSMLTFKLDHLVDELNAHVLTLSQDERVRRMLEQGDRYGLLRYVEPFFEQTLKPQNITLLYFLRADRTCLLRAHQPEKHGDRVDRFTLTEAARTGVIAHGLEIDHYGMLAFRTVAPLYDGERLVGLLELGAEINAALQEIRESLGLEILVLLHKNLLDRAAWERGQRLLSRVGDWGRLPTHVIAANTSSSVPSELVTATVRTPLPEEVVAAAAGDRYYYAGIDALRDVKGREVGVILSYLDATAHMERVAQHTWYAALACLLVGSAAFLLFFIYLGQVGREIDASAATTRLVIDAALDAFVAADHKGAIVEWNPQAETMFGWSRGEALGRRFRTLIAPSDQNRLRLSDPGTDSDGADLHAPVRMEITAVRADRTEFAAELTLTRLSPQQGVAFHAFIRDVTVLREEEHRLRTLAYKDSLTGLPNREFFRDRMAHALKVAARRKGRVALLFVDLDDFKIVNDSHGHHLGDRVLAEVAGCLLTAVRGSDTVARLGGDEFGILLEDVESSADAEMAAERIGRTMGQPIVLDGHDYKVGVSVGISQYPQDGADAEGLLRLADQAMYRAKAGGGGHRFASLPGEADKTGTREKEPTDSG
ncbi:diguanylate cyclase domain-containing protein [Planctomycetota bacterium]